MYPVRSTSLAVLLVGLTLAHAEAPKREHTITLDDYFTLAAPGEPTPSPDGTLVAFTESTWKEADNRRSDLWVLDVNSGKARALTTDRANARSPRWAPDGKHLYFLANRKKNGEKAPPSNGTTQVWRVGVAGGEPEAVTRVESGLASYQVTADGKSLFYLSHADRTPDDTWKRLREQFKDVEYNNGAPKESVVWRAALPDGKAESVWAHKRYAHEMAVTPDGSRLALISAPDDKVITFEGRSKIEICDLETRKTAFVPDDLWRRDAPSPYAWLEKLAWSPSGKALAFNAIFDAYPCEVVVVEWDADKVGTAKVMRPIGLSIRGYGSPLQWKSANELCFLGERKGFVRLCSVPDVGGGKHGDVREWTPGDVVVDAFEFAGGRAAVLMNGKEYLPDIHWVEKPGEVRRIANRNPHVDTWKLPTLSVVSWKGANGDTVEGILELPPGYEKGQKVPLVVEIHGGPTTSSYGNLQASIYGRMFLPARGYAVLSPNYRGSTGYGDQFMTGLVGKENDWDVEDILKGVDSLVAAGVADPDRLGVMGWSNGGYLTNCLISKTTRFKAASSGAGIIDTVMEFGANDEPAYSISLKGGFPWDRADVYRKTSPTYQLDKVRTPTLIHVGANDERCPPGHSRMLYRVLHEYNKVPSELLIYPGEPHGLAKYKSRKAKIAWDHAWFDRYILGKE